MYVCITTVKCGWVKKNECMCENEMYAYKTD